VELTLSLSEQHFTALRIGGGVLLYLLVGGFVMGFVFHCFDRRFTCRWNVVARLFMTVFAIFWPVAMTVLTLYVLSYLIVPPTWAGERLAGRFLPPKKEGN
jgi:hypothetical protein